MTKKDLIDYLNQTEYIATMNEDELLDWYIDLVHGYEETTGDDSLDKLFEKYWEPEDIKGYLETIIRDSNREPLDALQEVAEFLSRKKFDTWWSYFETDEEINFVDINKEELQKLHKRIIELLTEEEDNEEH